MLSVRHVLGLICLLLFGCSERELPVAKGRVIASGVVTWDGAALDAAEVTFKRSTNPASESSGNEFVAAINRGEFHIEIPPGDYRVEIRQFVSNSDRPAATDTPSPLKQVVPRQWNDESQLMATASTSKPNQFQFDLKSAASR